MKLVEGEVVGSLFDSIRDSRIKTYRTDCNVFFTCICLITSEFDVVVVVVVVVG